MKYKSFSILSLIIIGLFPFSSNGQEFDESFLKSLPKDVADDLLQVSKEKENLQETQYRRPSSFIKKTEQGDESIRFGHKYFPMMQTTLMPLNEPNFDASYLLDFGDELELQLIGQKSSNIKITVKRDGSINIPDIGKIFVSGISLSEATNAIKRKISNAYIGVEVFVTLTNVRDIQIIVSGNAYNPGSYTLNGNSNIFHALVVSGGPSENGSFRSIKLIRDEKVIEQIDLYNTFIYGKSNFKTRLRSGDIIFIDPAINIVSIQGAVNRPGEYELKEDQNLYQLIEYANGYTKYVDKNNTVLERILDARVVSIDIVNPKQLQDTAGVNGDSLIIGAHPFRKISIQGAIRRPGEYLMVEGDRMTDLISKAGGYTENAYPFATVIVNEDSLEISKNANKTLYKLFLQEIIKLSQDVGTNIDIEKLGLLAQEIKNAEPTGRIIVDMNDLDNDNNNLLLKNNDFVLIPELTNQIYVFGEIYDEGSTQYLEKNNDIDTYIKNKGGFKESADIKNIYIIQPNGRTVTYKKNKNIFATQNMKPEIYPGSIIYVPMKIENKSARVLALQSYASILGDIAISLASLSVLSDNNK